MPSQDDFIDIVNEKDIVIGKATEKEVQQKNLLHHSLHFLILDSQNRLFCAHRIIGRPIYSGWWTIPGVHIRSGEDYNQTAARFLSELKLEGDLRHLGKIRVADGFENEWSTLYILHSSKEPILSPDKFSEGNFFSFFELKHLCQTTKVTPYLLAALDCFSEIISIR